MSITNLSMHIYFINSDKKKKKKPSLPWLLTLNISLQIIQYIQIKIYFPRVQPSNYTGSNIEMSISNDPYCTRQYPYQSFIIQNCSYFKLPMYN